MSDLPAVVSFALRVWKERERKGVMGRKNQVMSRYESDFVCMDCRDGGFEDSPPMTRRRKERMNEE